MKLFLDDFRNPHDCLGYVKVFGIRPDVYLGAWDMVRDFDSFVRFIELNGLPDEVSFDHDLADEHYNTEKMYDGDYNELYSGFNEKTGLHAAKWLINYCIENNVQLPVCYVHSMNPVGRENINSILRNFDKRV